MFVLGLSFGKTSDNLADLLAIPFVEGLLEQRESGPRHANRDAIRSIPLGDGQFDDAVNDFNCGDFPDEQACNSHPQHSRKPLDPCLPLTVKGIDERLTDRNAAISGDTVPQLLQQHDCSGLIALVDSFIEARDDLCGVRFERLSDGAQGEQGGVIHPLRLP